MTRIVTIEVIKQDMIIPNRKEDSLIDTVSSCCYPLTVDDGSSTSMSTGKSKE